MVIDKELLDGLTEAAKVNPRRRMHYDLRTQAFDEEPGWKDSSQRILNVMMADTVIPIHRHSETSETVIVLKGRGDEVFYDTEGHETDRFTIDADSMSRMVQVPRNVYHTFIPHEDGTVIFESKDRAYDPEETEEFLEVKEE